MKRSKILIIFLGNPAHDSRSLKIFKSLSDLGYTVRIICAHQPGENFLNHPCILYVKIKSFKRAFFRILMFYIKALPLVLKEKTDIVIASDLFSLSLAWLASKKNNKAKLVYDSREIYSALASLHRRKFKQWLITKYETFFALNSNLILTVNESLNKFLSDKFYNKKIHTLHNFPLKKDETKLFIIPQKFFSPDSILLVYFGLFHPGRGLNLYFTLIEKLRHEFANIKLLLIGKGELKSEIENEIKKRNLQNEVLIFGPYSPEQYILMPSVKKIIGLCVIEPLGLSYFYSLPNKVFEYIQHQIPFIASDFPEIRNIVRKYNLGILVNPTNFEDVFSATLELIINDDLYENLKQNCKIALNELNWESEIEKFHEVIKSL